MCIRVSLVHRYRHYERAEASRVDLFVEGIETALEAGVTQLVHIGAGLDDRALQYLSEVPSQSTQNVN